MKDYEWVKDEMFDRMLAFILTGMTGEEILKLGSAYDSLSECLNNRVLEALERKREQDTLPPLEEEKELIEQRKKLMQVLAHEVAELIPKGLGFGILCFEFDESDVPQGELHWVSNARRPDMIHAMQEFIRKEAN